jgi:hypothetical protein
MISRRDFLKAAGIVLLSAPIPGFLLEPSAAPIPVQFEPLYGRVISGNAGEQGWWMDSVIPILDTQPQFYQTPQGLIPRRYLQPMLTPPHYTQTIYDPPFTGEVTGASVTLRHWCSGDAPAFPNKIGHGGLLRVVDRLEYAGIHWYGVRRADDERVYWTPSAPITPTTIPTSVPNLTLHIDHAAHVLTAAQGDHALFSAAFADRAPYPAGEYQVNQHTLIAHIHRKNYDPPFVTSFGEGLHICGAYWHNRFGEQWASEGIHVPPYVAKWLYGATASGARVMIA